jgi:hypothetical protein
VQQEKPPFDDKEQMSPLKQKKTLAEELAEQDALNDKSVSPLIKPVAGKNKFNFSSFADSPKSSSISPEKNKRDLLMSPDSEAKPIQ